MYSIESSTFMERVSKLTEMSLCTLQRSLSHIFKSTIFGKGKFFCKLLSGHTNDHFWWREQAIQPMWAHQFHYSLEITWPYVKAGLEHPRIFLLYNLTNCSTNWQLLMQKKMSNIRAKCTSIFHLCSFVVLTEQPTFCLLYKSWTLETISVWTLGSSRN